MMWFNTKRHKGEGQSDRLCQVELFFGDKNRRLAMRGAYRNLVYFSCIRLKLGRNTN